MTRSSIDLKFGTTFSRLWCDHCKAETLHHKNRCSCGSVHVEAVRPDKPLPFLAGSKAKAMSRRKA